MKREAILHTKMKRLCRRLDLPLWQAVGLLECIWHLTAREAPRGDIGKLSDEDVALGIDYRGDETKLIEALISSGWLDREPIGRLVIHDWAEHADDAVHNRLARARLYFVGGIVPKLTRLPSKERAEAAEFYESCAQGVDSCDQHTTDTATESVIQPLGVCATNVPPEPEPLPEPLPEPVPGAPRTSAPAALLHRVRSGHNLNPGGISPDTWDQFRNLYEESGKPLGEDDFRAAGMEVATQNLSQADMIERVIPALAAELPGWADREVKMIPLPRNWVRARPWTRTAKPRDPPLTKEQRRQKEIDLEWAHLGRNGNGTLE